MTVQTTNVQEVDTNLIHADSDFNCRGIITPIEVVDIAESIRIKGLLQPIVIMEYDEEQQSKTGFKYLLIAGYRRYTATTRILKRNIIACNIRPFMDEADARAINLSENFQRTDLNLLQEALALKKLFELGLTEQGVADKVGMSRGWVQIRFLILKLPTELHTEIAAGMYSQPQIRDLYSVMKRHGKIKTFEVAKEFKKAREKGRIMRKSANPKTLSNQKNLKRIRKRPAIFDMIEHISDSVGMGLATRALAWAAGEITTLDLYYSIKEHDDQHGDGNYVVDTSE